VGYISPILRVNCSKNFRQRITIVSSPYIDNQLPFFLGGGAICIEGRISSGKYVLGHFTFYMKK